MWRLPQPRTGPRVQRRSLFPRLARIGLAFLSMVCSFSHVSPVDAAAPGYVQSAIDSGSAAFRTLAFPSATTAGNLIVVSAGWGSGTVTASVTDSAGHLYKNAVGPVTNGSIRAQIWYAENIVGGADTVTVTFSASVGFNVEIHEYSGIATVGALDVAASRSGSGTALDSGLVVTTQPDELLFGYANVSGTVVWTQGPGYIIRQSMSRGASEDRTAASAGSSYDASFTISVSRSWNALVAAFKAAGAAPPDTVPPTVSITAPAADTTVSGTVTVSATASDNVGVVGVQFLLNGTDLGAEDTIAPYAVSWDTLQGTTGSHTLSARARDAAGNQTTSALVTVIVVNSGDASQVGQWSGPLAWPLVAIHAVLFHTGKVLVWDGHATDPIGGTSARLWDPATETFTPVPNGFSNIFCAGHGALADGRLLVAGGHTASFVGIRDANVFDPVTQLWTSLPPMTYARWYPTLTTLPDGRVLVVSGSETCSSCIVEIPELYDPVTNAWTQLTSARMNLPLYPYMFVLPDGRVLSAGSELSATIAQALEVTTQVWTTIDPIVRDGGSAVMPLAGKVMKAGRSADPESASTPAVSDTYVLDTAQPSPAWRQTAPMRFPRAYHTQTLLPDGSVLVTGGGQTTSATDISQAVYEAELWSPGTEVWTTMARMQTPRLYHSFAILLPDGRVLVAGGGRFSGATDYFNAEVYSPPYLFKGPRPTITSAPMTVQYGTTFFVGTPDASRVASVSLLRPGAVTHTFNSDQRFLNVTFELTPGGLNVHPPANASLAPPGYYMLFLIDTSGVPSAASFVSLPAPFQDTELPTAPGALTAAGSVGTVALSWTAATDNVGVANYNVHRLISSGFTLTPANRIAQPTSTSYTDAGLAAGTYYYLVTAQDAAGNISSPSNEASTVVSAETTPPSVSITAPLGGATVSGTITVSASASDNVGVVGVQFLLDGATLGTESTSAPYAIPWDTTTATDGAHAVTAIARDAATNATTAAAVTGTVDNTAPVIAAVTASAITSSGATITWTTDEVADSQVEYGATTAYGSMTPLDATRVTAHTQALSGLAASTLYHYRVKSRDASGNLATSADFILTTTVPSPFVCTQVIGFSSTRQWYLLSYGGGFEKVVDDATWQILQQDNAFVDRWANPTYSGWLLTPNSPCVQNSSTPDRVVLNLASSLYQGDVSWWIQNITNAVATIRSKIPSARQIVLMPTPGGPGNTLCSVAGVTTGLSVPRGNFNHLVEDVAIDRLISSGSLGPDVIAGPSPEVRTCADYSDTVGHLTVGSRDPIGRMIGDYFVSGIPPSFPAPTITFPFRVNAGSGGFTDALGNVWSADRSYSPSSYGYVGDSSFIYRTTSAIANAADSTMYQTTRRGKPFGYNFDIANGTYKVRLHFAEIYLPSFAVGARVGNISIEGVQVLSNFDVFAQAGAGNTAIVREFTVTVSDGQLNISLVSVVGEPIVNAIEVTPL